MERSFWKALLSSESLMEEAKADSIRMLDAGLEMFNVVLYAMHEEKEMDTRQRVATMDKALNNLQREVRRKVYEHLVISRTGDLLTGLQLTSIVIDLERIGDYTKNMAELVDMFPEQMNWDPYEERLEWVRGSTLEQFDLTRKALVEQNEKAGRTVIKRYNKISKRCDGVLEDIVTTHMGDTVEKRFLAVVLILRYFKRVNAHLKNVATTVVNPITDIGFRPGAV